MSPRKLNTILRVMLLPALLASPARADQAFLTPESIHLGDIASFVIEYDNSLPSLYALDTSALEQNFELLQKDSRIYRLTESSSAGHRMQWRMQVTPRRSGKLEIPAIRYGDRWTSPFYIEVKPRPAGERRVFVELDSSTPDPYVGQQTRISTRLLYDLPVDERIAETPDANDLRLQRSRPEKIYSAKREGRDFQVLEQEFALFPLRAGPLLLSPAGYRATIRENIGERRIIRRSEGLSLRVKSPPASYTGEFWLPATDLQMEQHWSDNDSELQVGDSLDWTLKIIARGLPAESLPTDLLAQTGSKIRVYADQAVLANRFEDGHIVGRLEQRFAVIATAPGTIQLPPLNLKWWDVVNDREAETRIEGRLFNISGVVTGQGAAEREGNPVEVIFSLIGIDYRPWITLLASLLLLAALVFVFGRLKTRVKARVEVLSRRRHIRQRLKQACLSNDASAARVALIVWARQQWPGKTIVGLRQVGDESKSTELRLRLEELDAVLFARESISWQGQALWRSLCGFPNERRSQPRTRISRLPGLYPGRV